ncbi:hypothetical protein BDN70DRAFT_870960 [Pholiota conissans]|uniref:Conidiation-specific protein 6 n=1 Tax=Pholiota conissans TaxID=109636 RepID=A0A9P5ZEH2_9AGAR|nr:hypothetical protein BDN70DRAFT_870960 [Pholiota conissans]
MSHTNTEGKNPEYVARGLKASIHNDGVSEEAKERAAQRLQDMGAEVPADYVESGDKEYTRFSASGDDDETDASARGMLSSNQKRGYKATLKNPNVSDEAKQHAQDVLEDSGSSY